MSNQDNSRIAYMAKNSVAANLLMLLFLVGGIIAAFYVKQEVFPKFDLDTITVSVSYPGASPEEVEKGIVIAVEDAVQGLENVEEVRSTASEGSATIIVEMMEGGDLQKLSNDVKNAVDAISSFPEESETPRIAVSSRKVDVIEFCLYGDVSEKELYELSEVIRDEIIQLKEVNVVEITGTRTPEITVEVPMSNLRRYGLTLPDIASRIASSNLEMPAGTLKTPSGEILVRVDERIDYGFEFEKLPIIYEGATALLLSDIATIKDEFEDVDKISLWNGKRAVFLEVYAMEDQKPVTVANEVIKFIDHYKEKLPDSIDIVVSKNLSDIYKQRVQLLIKNGITGWLLVVLLLAVFLDYRLAFWISLGIPVSFMGTILLMPMFGVSINMTTLFAFIITLGIVVDDAIIVGENIYALRQKKLPWNKAAIEGAKEVAGPVISSILTNIIAFIPLFFIPGILGKIYFQIPIVVIIAFSISLIESLFILPAHLSHIKNSDGNPITAFIHKYQQAFSNWFKEQVEDKSDKLVKKYIVRNRYLVLGGSILILIVVISLPLTRRVGMEFSPKIESDFSRAYVVLPYGTSFEETKKYALKLEKAALEIVEENGGDKLSEGIRCMIGETAGGAAIGGHYTEVRTYLTDAKIRPISTSVFTDLWRDKVGDIVGAENYSFESDTGGMGSGSAMTISLVHKDIEILKLAGEDLAEAFAQYPGVVDINDGYADGKVQLNYKINDKGRLLGFTSSQIASQLRGAFYGSESGRQQRDREELKIMVKLPENERVTEQTVDDFIAISSTGNQVKLSEIVDIQRGRSYTSITREDGRRSINVLADISPRSRANEVLVALEKDFLPSLKEKYQGLSYSYGGRQEDMKESLSALKTGFIFAFIGIYGLIAVAFKSYIQPAIIMIVIPFGMVGAILGHMVMGYSLSLMSMFGMIALAGVIVNDSLVLIELGNRKRLEGFSALDSIGYATGHRIRPVMLTTLTTFFGLAPMIFETSRQAKFLIPMAISMGFGILFATFITLLMVPSLYIIIEDFQKIFGIKSAHQKEED